MYRVFMKEQMKWNEITMEDLCARFADTINQQAGLEPNGGKGKKPTPTSSSAAIASQHFDTNKTNSSPTYKSYTPLQIWSYP